MSVLTVAHEFDQPIHRVSQASSGGSYVAIFTLRLAPTDRPEVSFASAVCMPEATPWIPFIQQGVLEFVEKRQNEGRPIGYLRVTLTEIWIHEVDSKDWRFTQAAVMAMEQAFAREDCIAER